ncbi:MAG TPA: trypsin-like peptidase domain-containing protein [Dehalococcoidia bacterium]|nr:trypsin-like peptidase domain-containing protein [Dehalococcoidia bacterium]
MRGLWWSAVLIGALVGGITGAALMFGLTQAFGGSGGGGHAAGTGRGVLTGADLSARNGLDAAAIYDGVRPSVVVVDTTTVTRRRRDQGEGSGIVLDTNGHILTNNHVVDGATRVQVTLADGKSYTASVLATDPNNDLAVIGITAPSGSLHPAKLGDPAALRVGDPVLTIGNPLGYEATLTEGVISGVDRTFDDGNGDTMQHLLQSDAAINPGNSGGPLINGRGEVVGVNTLLDNTDGTSEFSGIGFAVPIDAAKGVIAQAGQARGQ